MNHTCIVCSYLLLVYANNEFITIMGLHNNNCSHLLNVSEAMGKLLVLAYIKEILTNKLKYNFDTNKPEDI